MGVALVTIGPPATSGKPESKDGPPIAVGLPVDGPLGSFPTQVQVLTPRLARFRFRLSDGHDVGVAIAGSGIPLVVVHGFAAAGVLYAQTLSRLVGMGFKVIAIDTPGHGSTDPVRPFSPLSRYTDQIVMAIQELGINKAVLLGHSMGGRLVAEVAARQPERTAGVVLVDAIAGDTWDHLVTGFRILPAGLGVLGATLLADTISTLPVLTDPRQALKLAKLVFPIGANHVRRPWRLFGPLVSILLSPASSKTLDEIVVAGLSAAIIHGDRDLAVPFRTSQFSAKRLRCDFVAVHGAAHSWLLRDPETLPAIVAELLEGGLGRGLRAALKADGLDLASPSQDIERAWCTPNSTVVAPMVPPELVSRGRHRSPRYRWTVTPAADKEPQGC